MGEQPGRQRKPRGEALPHLEAWRRQRGFTQAELAARAGITRGTVSRAEAGTVIQYPSIRQIAEALGLTVAELRAAPKA